MGNSIRPSKDADYLAWAKNIAAKCAAQPQWGIDSMKLATLNTLVTNADTAYAANLNRETANHYTATVKKAAFDALKPFMSGFVVVLEANDLIPNEELVAMGLPSRIHHHHDPLPDPTESPDIHAVVGEHDVVTVYVDIPQQGHPSEYLTRKGYRGFVVQYKKEGDAEWREESTTRLHITLVFAREDEGKHLQLQAAWLNPRLHRGPWSDELTVLIN
jgi:hypothetical protein